MAKVLNKTRNKVQNSNVSMKRTKLRPTAWPCRNAPIKSRSLVIHSCLAASARNSHRAQELMEGNQESLSGLYHFRLVCWTPWTLSLLCMSRAACDDPLFGGVLHIWWIMLHFCCQMRLSTKILDRNTDSRTIYLSLIHIWRCRRSYACRSRWSPYH